MGVTAAVLKDEETIPVVRDESTMHVMRGAKEEAVVLIRTVLKGF